MRRCAGARRVGLADPEARSYRFEVSEEAIRLVNAAPKGPIVLLRAWGDDIAFIVRGRGRFGYWELMVRGTDTALPLRTATGNLARRSPTTTRWVSPPRPAPALIQQGRSYCVQLIPLGVAVVSVGSARLAYAAAGAGPSLPGSRKNQGA
jgi:hypothetical protein